MDHIKVRVRVRPWQGCLMASVAHIRVRVPYGYRVRVRAWRGYPMASLCLFTARLSQEGHPSQIG